MLISAESRDHAVEMCVKAGLGPLRKLMRVLEPGAALGPIVAAGCLDEPTVLYILRELTADAAGMLHRSVFSVTSEGAVLLGGVSGVDRNWDFFPVEEEAH